MESTLWAAEEGNQEVKRTDRYALRKEMKSHQAKRKWQKSLRNRSVASHLVYNIVPAEIIKGGGEFVAEVIWELVTRVWWTEELPKRWKMGLACSTHIYKEGGQLDSDKYSGFTLLCATYQTFTHILRRRRESISEYLPRKGGGGWGTWLVSFGSVSRTSISFLQTVTAYGRRTKRRRYKILAEQRISRKMAGPVRRTVCQRQWHKWKGHYRRI